MNNTINLYTSGNGGKSMYMQSYFENWYSSGNRMPDTESVIILDAEEVFKMPEDKALRIKHVNLIWFLVKYCGYTTARIVRKN